MSDDKPSPSTALVRRGPGRPTLYSEEVAEEIVSRLAGGETLIRVCSHERSGRVRERGEFPVWDTVMNWADPAFHACIPAFIPRFAQARLRQQQFWMEEIVEIANNPEPGYEEVLEQSRKLGVTLRRTRKDMISHRALKIETRLKAVAKINPQLWAERLQMAAPVDASNEPPRLIVEGGLPETKPPEPTDPEGDA